MGSVPRIARWFRFLSSSLSPFRSLILFSFLQQVKKQVSAVLRWQDVLGDEGRKIRPWKWQLSLLVRVQGSNGERGSVSFSSRPLPGTALSLCRSHISHPLLIHMSYKAYGWYRNRRFCTKMYDKYVCRLSWLHWFFIAVVIIGCLCECGCVNPKVCTEISEDSF